MIRGFLRDDSNDSSTDANETDTEETVNTEVVEETREAEYTEHTAVALYVDGTEEEYVFDSMSKDESGITLKRYTGAYEKTMPYLGSVTKFNSEAFVTISYGNLKSLETTNREDKTLKYTTMVEREVEDSEE